MKLKDLKGTLHFIWNFLTFIPAAAADKAVLFLFGIIDAVFVGILATTLHQETHYIALSNTECHKLSRYGNTTDQHLVLFQRIWQTNITDNTLGPDTCNGYLAKWYIGLVIL